MKVPKAKKLSSGKWFIYLRLGGQQISVTGPDEKSCIRNAQQVKADWLAQKRLPDELKPQPAPDPGPTVREAIEAYITERDSILSPSTVRGYRTIVRTRFKSIMDRRVADIGEDEWQRILNDECKLASGKTVKNAFALVKSALNLKAEYRIDVKRIQAPRVDPHDIPFLEPEEIPTFIREVKDNAIAVPALLAISSLRASEIAALRWENIPPKAKAIEVRGAMVRDEHDKLVLKKRNKTTKSTRTVPIMIPELAEAIERDRKPEGPVLEMGTNWLRQQIHRACRRAGVTDVPLHGLRHTFASLCYHLNIPEEIVMEIGGWDDIMTVRKIYTRLARSDVKRHKQALYDFFAPPKDDAESKNAN